MSASDTYPTPRAGAALAATWDAAWSLLGRPAPAGLRAELMAAWSEPHRHYHDLRHLGECLALWQRWKGLARRPEEVAIALWFHDAVYEPQGTNNELKSASWAARSLSAAGAGDEVVERVYGLIMATRHGEPIQVSAPAHVSEPAHAGESHDTKLLLDIDLAILGSPSERFEAYTKDIRSEYAWVPGYLYTIKRAAVLQGFVARPRIYHTAAAAELLEAQARRNLQAAISRLRE